MKIRKRKYRSGKVAYQLEGGIINGKRYQRSFTTQIAAEKAKTALEKELKKFGHIAADMSAAERLEYAEAKAKLQAAGVSLQKAVDWALERAGTVIEQVTLEVLRTRFLADLERRNKRPRYVRQVKSSTNLFVRGRETTLATAVRTCEIEAWLSGNAWSPKTQAGYLGDVATMFSFGTRKRLVGVNPAKGVQPAEDTDDGEISAYNLPHVQQLFSTIVNYKRPWRDPKTREISEKFVFRSLLGFAALATFCGVRPERELGESENQAIQMETGVFVVEGKVAKTGARRPVEMPEAALEWLEYWRELCGEDAPLIPPNFRNLWRECREVAGLKAPEGQPGPEWPHDVLRHTAATMHYAMYQNAAVLKAMLGHSKDEDTLHRHYRAVRSVDGVVITRAIAVKFYGYRPTRN